MPGMGGLTLGPFIFIKSSVNQDYIPVLLEHEKKHVEQFYRAYFWHSIKYVFSRDYRLECEAEAYAQNVKHYGEYTLSYYANIIISNRGYAMRKWLYWGDPVYTLQEVMDRIRRYL